MQLDLTYLPQEDRLRLSVRGNADWVLTRSFLFRLIDAWLDKLQNVELPDIGIALGPRDLEREHALSLEFDAPKSTNKPSGSESVRDLLSEVSLTVDSTGTVLLLKGQQIQTQLTLTRKESHLVLELLAKKAREIGWTDPVKWPPWLGSQ